MDTLVRPRLQILTGLPAGFLNCTAADLYRILPRPALIHLPGKRSPALFVSILLHGNEDVGLQALQRVLAGFAGRELPRALSLFIGNVEAARAGVRRLDDQPDYNRVWPGTDVSECPEAAMMREVTGTMRARGVFASIDLHNNTGLNPHYACVTSLTPAFLQLAGLFSRTVVYFQTPRGVQSAAFSSLAPAITCECGKTGDESGVTHAAQLVEACLRLEHVPDHPVREGDVHLFHTVATIKPAETLSMSFDGTPADLQFVTSLDHYNFRELEAGTLLARSRDPAALHAHGESGDDITSEVLIRVADGWRLRKPFMPAMLTRDERVVRQDCLCYLMQRMPLPPATG